MIVEMDNLRSRVVNASAAELAWLRKYLAFDEGERQYKKRVDMFEVATETFPSGFVTMAKNAALAAGYRFDVVDRRVPPGPPDDSADLSWLRPDQLEGVRRCITKTRGILWLPTASGKTEIAVGCAVRVPCDWLFVVNSTQLADQAAARFELRTGLPAGRIGEGVWTTGRFTAATFQTLYSRLQANDPRAMALLGDARGLIVDEVHTLPAHTFWAVAMASRNAYYRIGMSGTPLARDDGKSPLAIAATGMPIYRLMADKLIEAGVISKPRIRLVAFEHDADDGLGAFPDVYRRCIVENDARNAKVVAMARRAAKPNLTFAKAIEHGHALKQQMERAGLRVAFVWGANPTEERKADIKRLVRGDLDVIIASVVFNTGVDIPSLRSIVNAAAGKSAIASIQRIGRGMRVQKDRAGNVVKDEFEVYDFKDTGIEVLERHSMARIHAYTSEGYETVVLSDQGVLL